MTQQTIYLFDAFECGQATDAIRDILTLIQEEHEIAATHAQRNAFQAVIRIKLEHLQSRLRWKAVEARPLGAEDIPF